MTSKVSMLLEKIGFRRIHAGVLTELIKVQGTKVTARALEKACDLRQPEVSLALSYFTERKWVSVSNPEPAEKKGRPEKLYLLISPEKVYVDIEKEQQKNMESTKEVLAKLKSAMTLPKNPEASEQAITPGNSPSQIP